MYRHLVPISLAAAVLAGCVQPPQAAPVASAPLGGCQADAARFAIGYTSTDALADEVRRRSGASTVRVLRPGDVTTMEFNAERVNVVVGEDSRVSAVRCG